MSKAQAAVDWCKSIAANPAHGYDQTNRWGPDYDCSSLIIEGWQEAGVPVKDAGATYTGNIYPVFTKKGFQNVKSKVNIATGAGLQLGDICLIPGKHVIMYIGNGKIVHASINELGKITGGQPGDQTGKEICIRSYYNNNWTYVLRYTGESSSVEISDGILRRGDKGSEVKEMQTNLITAGYSCGSCGADGDFGTDTEKALKAFQTDYSLTVDGEYGPISKAKLNEVVSGKSTGKPTFAKGKVYTTQVELKVRTGPGTNYLAKSHSELTADGQAHDTDKDGAIDKGTRVTCLAYKEVGDDIWIQTPSDWMAAYYQGKVYIT